ncbi:glutaredoxin domain-containing protein [Candidatus Poriferisocius sp.]|uniref:glutaredoxin domain-containing protein n=1 Tax=Candidatus Poriferisocius sp. TaxID=3101276 RepID=UPI003B010FB9
MSAAAPVGSVTFYWRPGCGFCAHLHRELDKLEVPLDMHNIWEDPAAAAFVRSVANGNETVPTVVVGGAPMVNPDPAQVMAALADRAPHLVPEGYEPPKPGPVGRMLNRLLGG